MYYKNGKLIMYSREILKGTIKPIILKLLSNNKKLYGYQITQMVKVITHDKIKITEGALYPALHQLVDEGLLKTEKENIGNRIRIYYLLSDFGKKEVSSRLEEIIDYISTMIIIFDINPKKA